jgi:hypothetical protein
VLFATGIGVILGLRFGVRASSDRDLAIGVIATFLAVFAAILLTRERSAAPSSDGNAATFRGPDPVRPMDGWFWFPPARERAFGTIEIRPRDLRLTLRDSARPQEEWRELAVIHGESLDGKELTILGAFVTGRHDYLNYGHNIERYRFNALLIGAHVLDEAELVFNRGVVHLRGLREWMSASWQGRAPYAFQQLVAAPPRGLRQRFTAWRERRRDDSDPDSLPHPLEVSLPGATLKFAYERRVGGPRFEQQTIYDASAVVELDTPLQLDRWREEWVRPLLDLLVFATREQVVVERFDAIVFDNRLAEAVHPAIRRAAPDHVWARREIEVVRPQVVEVRERGIRSYEHMLLPLGALGEDAPAKITRYFEVYRALGRSAAFFFVVLNARTIHEENRLLNLMAYAEGYHRTFHDEPPLADAVHERLKGDMLASIDKQYRRVYEAPLKYANQQTQRQRLKFLIGHAAAAVSTLADHKNAFRDALVETRNQYTHQGEGGPNVIDDADLYDYVERFIEVLEVNLLLDLGVDAGTISALHRQAHPR